MTAAELRHSILRYLKYSLGKDAAHATLYDWRVALSLAIRERITDSWFEGTRAAYAGQNKRVYYLSMEFLIGRLLQDAIVNLGLLEVSRDAISMPSSRPGTRSSTSAATISTRCSARSSARPMSG